MYCNHINRDGSDVISWNTNQKSFIMHKWSQLRYTNELFPNSRELVILLLIASPLIRSVALFLCTHKLAPLSLHAHFPALVFSFPCAHMVAPFRSSTICPLCSVTCSLLIICPLHYAHLITRMHATLRWAHFFAFLRSFSRSAALVRSLHCARSPASSTAHVYSLRTLSAFVSLRVYKDRNPPFVIFNLCQRVPIEEMDKAF